MERYITNGKCRWNAELKIVLQGGGFVARAIAGNTLAEQIDKWHRQHPNQLAKGQLSSNTTSQLILESIVSPEVLKAVTYANKAVSSTEVLQLSKED